MSDDDMSADDMGDADMAEDAPAAMEPEVGKTRRTRY